MLKRECSFQTENYKWNFGATKKTKKNTERREGRWKRCQREPLIWRRQVNFVNKRVTSGCGGGKTNRCHAGIENPSN